MLYDDQLKARVGRQNALPFSFDILYRCEIDWRNMDFFADPLNVGPYTETLLDNAPHISGLVQTGRSSGTQLDRLLGDLPQELFDRIVEELCPLDVTTTCTRVVSPTFWRGLLVTPGVLPFLWDIDTDVVCGASDEIDWEMLVRTLAQPHPFDQLPGIPLGLRNRYSIWAGLQERLSASLPEVSKFSTNGQPSIAESREASGDDEGPYTWIETEWARRTEEEQRRYSSFDFRSGHWTLKWHRVPTGG